MYLFGLRITNIIILVIYEMSLDFFLDVQQTLKPLLGISIKDILVFQQQRCVLVYSCILSSKQCDLQRTPKVSYLKNKYMYTIHVCKKTG